MSDKPRLFVVDDVAATRRLFEQMFRTNYEVETFAGAADCLSRLSEATPDLFILDVEMPDIDGYALCSQLRELPNCRDLPVLFASAAATLDEQLRGYDAGGDDFVVKPVIFPELKPKIDALLRRSQESAALRQQLADSDMLTSLVMANLDEYAVLVKFLRSLNACESYRDVTLAILAMLDAFRLNGVVQFRFPGFELTLNQAGEVRPLEASIINQVRSLGTVAEYRNRAAFSFERVSVMVNNMPLADPELCGRLRDHLSISVETADSKLHAMMAQQANRETRDEIAALVQAIGSTVHEFHARYERARGLGGEITHLLLRELDREFANLGMREVQEDSIKEVVISSSNELMRVFDFSDETEATLQTLSSRLLRATTTDA